MAQKKGIPSTGKADTLREQRLKAALKANLARRKAQSRARTQSAEAEVARSPEAGQNKDA